MHFVVFWISVHQKPPQIVHPNCQKLVRPQIWGTKNIFKLNYMRVHHFVCVHHFEWLCFTILCFFLVNGFLFGWFDCLCICCLDLKFFGCLFYSIGFFVGLCILYVQGICYHWQDWFLGGPFIHWDILESRFNHLGWSCFYYNGSILFGL